MEYRKEHRFDGVEISLALFFDLSREGSSAFLVDDLDLEEFWKNAVHFFSQNRFARYRRTLASVDD